MAFTDITDITIDGKKYYADEIVIKSLLIVGTEPTDYEQYNHTNILVLHRNAKEINGVRAGGFAQANYKFGRASDVHKFHEIGYPMRVDAKVATTAVRKGETIDMVVDIDFDNAKKVNLVEQSSKLTSKAS